MSTIEELTAIYPEQLSLELSPEDIEKAWPAEAQFSSNISKWNAYLNRLCLQTIIRYLETESEFKVIVNSDEKLASIWEVVNGTPITFDGTKLVIIPSEAIDTAEFRVPQEWVDIPEWVADYYLAVQINSDDGWLRVWGYTTHKQLKDKGIYDESDRSYSIDGEDVIESLDVMWMARELCPHERGEVQPLPNLPVTEVDTLLEQLSQEDIYYSPRLEIPFTQWGALLVNEDWRKRLHKERIISQTRKQIVKKLDDIVAQGNDGVTLDAIIQSLTKISKQFDDVVTELVAAVSDQTSVSNVVPLKRNNIVYISNWKNNRLGNGWELKIAMTRSNYLLPQNSPIQASKLFNFDVSYANESEVAKTRFREEKSSNLSVKLDVNITTQENQKIDARFQVFPVGNYCLPSDLELIIQQEGEILESPGKRQDESLERYLEGGSQGDQLDITLKLADISFTERFIF
ncbi:MAG: DUF1822 family protein [Cyanobacteria bacterium P01_G01_bin.49]